MRWQNAFYQKFHAPSIHQPEINRLASPPFMPSRMHDAVHLVHILILGAIHYPNTPCQFYDVQHQLSVVSSLHLFSFCSHTRSLTQLLNYSINIITILLEQNEQQKHRDTHTHQPVYRLLNLCSTNCDFFHTHQKNTKKNSLKSKTVTTQQIQKSDGADHGEHDTFPFEFS